MSVVDNKKDVTCKNDCADYKNGCLYVNGKGIHSAPTCIGFKPKENK